VTVEHWTEYVVPYCFAFWIALAAGGAVFFSLNRNAALKRRGFRIYITVVCVAFAGFVWYTMGLNPVALFIMPFLGLIGYLNIRMTLFCDSCGRTVISGMWWSKADYCPRCGAKLP